MHGENIFNIVEIAGNKLAMYHGIVEPRRSSFFHRMARWPVAPVDF